MQTRISLRERPQWRSGFTLIELLVVITIIGILLALVTVAGFRAILAVRSATIAMDINAIESSINDYRTKGRDFFPDTVTSTSVPQQNIVLNHLRTLYSRHREMNVFAANRGDGVQGAFYQVELDPSEAFVYFLGGNPTMGPYDNPEYPLSGPGQKKVYYEFKKERLVDPDGDGFYSYLPAYGGQAPFVYFDSRSYATTAGYGSAALGYAFPYGTDSPIPATGATPQNNWESPSTFQIISAGLDGNYGMWPNGLPTAPPPPAPAPYKFYPSGAVVDPSSTDGSRPNGTQYTKQDRDNVTSFADGRLDSKMP